jgi:hypothetical protein
MKSFKQFLEQVGNIKQISYPAAVSHKVYNPLTSKSKKSLQEKLCLRIQAGVDLVIPQMVMEPKY